MLSTKRRAGDERGFSSVEVLVAMAITATALGTALTVTEQVSRGYHSSLDNTLIQEEARYALDWIETTLQGAGANPYGVVTSNCPANGTPFAAIRLDPNGNGILDDVRLQGDVNPPNGLIGGVGGICDEAGEDVTIALNQTTRAITLRDNNLGTPPVPMTDAVFTSLRFAYLDATETPTAAPDAAAFVRITLTAETPNANRSTGAADQVALSSIVRIRTR